MHYSNPRNTVFDIKRLVGRCFSDPLVQIWRRDYSFGISDDGHGGLLIDVEWRGERKKLTVLEILSMIFAKAKENAEKYLEVPVSNVAIGVPSRWTSKQRGIVRDAALVVSLNVIALTTGPAAVALAWAHQELAQDKIERNILIFDLGSGHFNTTLACVEEGFVEMKAVNGDTTLGGRHFVNRLLYDSMKFILKKWKVDIAADTLLFLRLQRACERAMKKLSSAMEAQIEIESLVEGRDFLCTITRDIFEEVCMDLFRATLQPINLMLDHTGIKKSEVHGVALAGGASRIPGVQKLVADYFNGKALTETIDSDEAEVYGLAILAAVFTGEGSKILSNLLLLNIIPSSIGIETPGGFMDKIMPRNTMYPNKASKMVLVPRNTEFFYIYEGDRIRTRDNLLLAKVDASPLHLNIGVTGSESEFIRCTINILLSGNCCGECILESERTGRKVMVWIFPQTLDADALKDLMAKAQHYQLPDDQEAARTEARANVESRITLIRESLQERNCGLAPDHAQQLSVIVDEFQAWVNLDRSKSSTIDDYESRIHDLERIEQDIKDMAEEVATGASQERIGADVVEEMVQNLEGKGVSEGGKVLLVDQPDPLQLENQLIVQLNAPGTPTTFKQGTDDKDNSHQTHPLQTVDAEDELLESLFSKSRMLNRETFTET